MISKQKNRILGTWNNILKFDNKDRNKVLLIDWFNSEVRNALTWGLWFFNDYKKDSWLITTLDEQTKKNLTDWNFDEAGKIINTVKNLNSDDILNIGADKIKTDWQEIYNKGWDIFNNIKSVYDNVEGIIKNMPIIVMIIIVILIFKK